MWDYVDDVVGIQQAKGSSKESKSDDCKMV
jgi:hypothetical protein